MKTDPEKAPIERYLGIDLHKEYVMIEGQNEEQEWVLRPREHPIRSLLYRSPLSNNMDL